MEIMTPAALRASSVGETVEKPGINVQMRVELVLAGRARSDTETQIQPHGRSRGLLHLMELFLVPTQYLAIRNMVSQKRLNAALTHASASVNNAMVNMENGATKGI